MQKPRHGTVKKSMLDQDWIGLVPFLLLRMPDPPKSDIRIVLCYAFINIQNELLMLDELV
jgi:hypothetical protein